MSAIVDKLKKQKVAIYIRVSTRWQIDKDSLKVQRRELIAYAEMVLGISNYVIFEDPGYSAKNTDRPEYQNMISRLRTGEFSHLLVWKIDRISRNLLDFATMYSELKTLGVSFVSKNEQFDTSSAVGEAMLKIILVFAELERNMTSERVTAVMLSRASNGQWNGGKVPYGYSWDKEQKVFTLDIAENKVYNSICDIYEQYQSIVYVCRYLNNLGFRTRTGKEWTATSVHKILRNRFYLGEYIYNVHNDRKGIQENSEDEWITIKDHHIPSISEDRFDRIQFIMSRNRRGGVADGKTYVKKNIHIFAGLVRCGICGSNMSATQDRRRADGWRPSVYGCSKRRHDTSSCINKYISDIVLGPFVFNYIANIIRAKKTVSAGTSEEVLERKLLRGDAFDGITHIDGISELLNMLKSGKTGVEYISPVECADSESRLNEIDLWESRRRRLETALNRLKALYLYGDEDTPEKDFIIERSKIINELENIEVKIAELNRTMKTNTMNDDDFIQKASYFIMVQQLLNDRYVDYEKYIRKIDPSIPRNFIKTVVKQIDVEDGKVTSIAFMNGMKNTFVYE